MGDSRSRIFTMYSGFKLIKKLPSINQQRLIERKVLENILVGKQPKEIRVISIGVGDGEELNFLLASPIVKRVVAEIVCIDILGDYFHPCSLPKLKDLQHKVIFVQGDTRNLHRYFRKAEFDIIQCGFLLHELRYDDKNDVLLQFSDILKPSGYFVCSDIYMDNCKRQDPIEDLQRIRNIERLYNLFIEEATKCVKNRSMTQQEWELLCGNGVKDGLLRSMKRAVGGFDDYYEPLPASILRLGQCGFEKVRTNPNVKNEYLFVLSARKT